ncbi:MAG: hypothetical protein Q8Q67_01905 [bacterium]|nr:hypothetical protein [bacterium]
MNRKWLYRLLILDLILVGAHLLWGDQYYILNLDNERTIPAYYSGLKLVFIAGLSFTIFALLSKAKEKWLWLLVSMFFVILAFDEISELHENLGIYFLGLFDNYNFFEQASFMWVVYLSPIIIGVLVLLIYLLYSQRKTKSFPYILVGIICFALVIAFEYIGGMIIRSHHDVYQATIVLEEAMEKIGASFFLFGMWNIFNSRFKVAFIKNN